MRALALFIVLLAWTLPAYSDGEPPVIYSKTVIKIVPKIAAPPAPVQKDKKAASDNTKAEEVLPVLSRVAKEFTVEVRPIQFLDQKDFIALQPFSDTGGMLLLVAPPQVISLKPAKLLAKLDIAFVTEDGLIVKIAPGLVLNTLPEAIDSERPLRALLFLKSGAVKANDIRPGDHVENALFKTHPAMME